MNIKDKVVIVTGAASVAGLLSQVMAMLPG